MSESEKVRKCARDSEKGVIESEKDTLDEKDRERERESERRAKLSDY